jgi:hypothetical protein
MRTWLRRRLNETTPDQWADSALNDYLNEGLRFMQQEIERMEPEAFIYEDSANLVSGQREYAWPVNMKREVTVGTKWNSSATAYTDVGRVGNRKADNPDNTENEYAHKGRYLKFSHTPTENVTKGIWLEYIPILSMGDDADVPDIPIDLHMGIVLSAQLTAFGDSSGSTDKQEVRAELADVMLRLPNHYKRIGGEPDKMTVSPHYRTEPGDMDSYYTTR